MKIGLIQVDGKLPNLALMKLSAFHKKRGDDVILIDISTHKFDYIYGSKIFMGGSGYDIKQSLPKDIDVLVPDYDLYNIDYSIGFTTRGCIRDCGFCIVKEKEGNFRENTMNFIKHSKVILMDNNFLASKYWKEKCQYFIDNQIKVNFNQGLDIRLITPENAKILSKVLYYDVHFQHRRLYFAFDDLKYEDAVIKGIKILTNAEIKPNHLMFYVLCGFNTTFEQDMYRFELLNKMGVKPFIMLYNNCKNKKLRDFARWVNKRYYKIFSFENYKSCYTKLKRHEK